jgi:hypothetical protein
MKKALFFLGISLVACQPATESRAHMENTSDRMSDSILKLIDSSLAEPAKVLAASESPIASAASSFTPVNQPK